MDEKIVKLAGFIEELEKIGSGEVKTAFVRRGLGQLSSFLGQAATPGALGASWRAVASRPGMGTWGALHHFARRGAPALGVFGGGYLGYRGLRSMLGRDGGGRRGILGGGGPHYIRYG